MKDYVSTGGRTVFDPGKYIGVVGGPNTQLYATGIGDALGGRLDRVQRPAEVALFCDCGVRPYVSTTNLIDRRDVLFFTSNYDGTLLGTFDSAMKKDVLGARFPIDRHDSRVHEVTNRSDLFKFDPTILSAGRINIGFADGHADHGQSRRLSTKCASLRDRR